MSLSLRFINNPYRSGAIVVSYLWNSSFYFD